MKKFGLFAGCMLVPIGAVMGQVLFAAPAAQLVMLG